jgi:hypothetical protein
MIKERMRFVLLSVLVSAAAACNRPTPSQHASGSSAPAGDSGAAGSAAASGPPVGGTAPLASVVSTADRATALQLREGFYAIEEDAWRWVGERFVVELRPPAGAAQRGATLIIKLSVPPTSIEKLHALTASCDVGGAAVAPETWTKTGKYTLTRDVDQPITTPTVNVTCRVDKSFQPGGTDKRQLSFIVSSVGLIPR